MDQEGQTHVVLLCTSCQHVFKPDLLVQLSQTGCERCGGWTWIVETSAAATAIPTQRGTREPLIDRMQGEQR
jgi:hypothetical protein